MCRCSGAAAGVPRRFRMRTARPAAEDSNAIRSGAGEDSRAAASGRKSATKAELASAASARRRNSGYRASGSHATKPRQLAARSACSAAQSASRRPGARTTTRLLRSTPAAANPGAYGTCGGASQTTRFPELVRRASAGRTSCNSPMPSTSARISVSTPVGQPPPGNSASRDTNPVGSAGTTARAGEPRHTGWRCRISARSTVLYFYTVLGSGARR
jgi:hypothetical protein